MLYGVWMARQKHRLAKAVWKVADSIQHPEFEFAQRWLDKVADWLVTSASKQATKAVCKRLGNK